MFSAGVLWQVQPPAAQIPGRGSQSWCTFCSFCGQFAAVSAQGAARSTGWQSRVRYLPQPPLASGVLTLVVQSFGHSRVAAAQPQPLRPALLLQHLPAKALAEEKNCHRAAGQSPSSSFQKLLPTSQGLGLTATALPLPSAHPELTLVYLSKVPICCPATAPSSKPSRRRCSSRIRTESRASLSPPSRGKGAQVRAEQLHAAGRSRQRHVSPPAPRKDEAEPVLFGISRCQITKTLFRVHRGPGTLSKGGRGQELPSAEPAFAPLSGAGARLRYLCHSRCSCPRPSRPQSARQSLPREGEPWFGWQLWQLGTAGPGAGGPALYFL